MTEKDRKDLEELLNFLRAQGYQAEACDKAVPFYDCGVIAGYPEAPGDYSGEMLLIPNVPNGDVHYSIMARGESMIDAGIDDGDTLFIEGTTRAEEGDIVIAYINGETTVKTFLLDKSGNPWLVPQNENYLPIAIREEDDFRIMGRVVAVKKPVKIDLKVCRKLFDRISPKTQIIPGEEKVKRAVREVAQKIKFNRQWYAVFRVLIDKGYYESIDDIYTFIDDVREWLPELDIRLEADDLKKMAVLSFAKSVTFWDASDAPVYGKRFQDYLSIARSMIRLL